MGVILRWKYFDIDTGDSWSLFVVSFQLYELMENSMITTESCIFGN